MKETYQHVERRVEHLDHIDTVHFESSALQKLLGRGINGQRKTKKDLALRSMFKETAQVW